MKHFFTPIFLFPLAMTPLAASASTVALSPADDAGSSTTVIEEADTLPSIELQEIVVQGRTQRVVKYGVEYIPDKKTKRNSLNATNLLLKMQIPQLDVNPLTSKVTTITGQEVSFFIDYVPASSDQLSGMRTEDVLRVEVLDHPADPRFNGAAHVVNYVMVKYEWGGYTKAMLSSHFLSDDFVGGGLFSRFVYKNWQFDATASGGGFFFNRKPESTSETFRDVDFLGRHYDEVTRTTSTDHYRQRSDNQDATFRFVYQKENVYIHHSVAFTRFAQPKGDRRTSLKFSVPELAETDAEYSETNLTLSPSVNGYYFFNFPKQNSLSVNWSFSYNAQKRYSDYKVPGLDPIVNNNREKVYTPSVQLFYTKVLPRQNMIRAVLYSYASFYHTEYSGSYDGTQKLVSNENMFFLEYMKNWNFGLSLYSRVGVSNVEGRVNGVSTLNEWNPRLGLQLQYRINDKNSVTLEGWWGNNHPDPSTANDALVQSNELMWLQGNPDLRNTIFNSASLSYNWIPTNKFSLSGNLSYSGYQHRQAYLFHTLPGVDGLVRQVVNSGNYSSFSGYLSASLRLLQNSLVLTASGGAGRMMLSGMDGQNRNYITGNARAQYMGSNWTVALFYNSPSVYLGGMNFGYVFYNKGSYGVSFSYAFGDFQTEVQFNNWFCRDYLSHTKFNSSRYSVDRVDWAPNLSRIVNLAFTYTLPYGKKVSRSDEASAGSGRGSSAILK